MAKASLVTGSERRPLAAIVPLAVLAWLGMIVHDAHEFPTMSVADPQVLGPTLAWVVLVAAWVARPSRLSTGFLLGWALLHLIGGGIVSVLPLPLLPFTPGQTLDHYAVHVVYAAALGPIVLFLWRRAGSTRGSARTAPGRSGWPEGEGS